MASDADPSISGHAERSQVVKAAGIIGIATFSSRILGFIRDMVLARLFGAGAAADAFFVAYRIPNLLRELFAEGSMSAAFIPIFSEYLAKRSKRDAWELASAAFTTLLTILTGVCVLGILTARWIVPLIAPGFSEGSEKQALTILLAQIMFELDSALRRARLFSRDVQYRDHRLGVFARPAVRSTYSGGRGRRGGRRSRPVLDSAAGPQ